jgi:hypothetical protein
MDRLFEIYGMMDHLNISYQSLLRASRTSQGPREHPKQRVGLNGAMCSGCPTNLREESVHVTVGGHYVVLQSSVPMYQDWLALLTSGIVSASTPQNCQLARKRSFS